MAKSPTWTPGQHEPVFWLLALENLNTNKIPITIGRLCRPNSSVSGPHEFQESIKVEASGSTDRPVNLSYVASREPPAGA